MCLFKWANTVIFFVHLKHKFYRIVAVEGKHADHLTTSTTASVTRKKLPNDYKSCPNMISIEKW